MTILEPNFSTLAVFDTQTTDLTWPEKVTVTARGAFATYRLYDPKGREQAGLLTIANGSASFTPTYHSGGWTVVAVDAQGRRVAEARVRLGDALGWMVAPDWDDAGWTVTVQAGGVITARSGNDITIDNVAVTTPANMDIIWRAIDIPIGLQMETELFRSAISGNDDTSILMFGAANGAPAPAGLDVGSGIEQTTAGTQRGIRWKDAATAYVGAADATVRRMRTNWCLGSDGISNGVIERAMTVGGANFAYSSTNYGGFGFHVSRDFGVWVGRVTADGSAYAVQAMARMKVS